MPTPIKVSTEEAFAATGKVREANRSPLTIDPQAAIDAMKEEAIIRGFFTELRESINVIKDCKRGDPEQFFRIINELKSPENEAYKYRIFKEHRDLISDITDNKYQTEEGKYPNAFNGIQVIYAMVLFATNESYKSNLVSTLLCIDLEQPHDPSITKERLESVLGGIINGENYEEIERIYNFYNGKDSFQDHLTDFSPEFAEGLKKEFEKYKSLNKGKISNEDCPPVKKEED